MKEIKIRAWDKKAKEMLFSFNECLMGFEGDSSFHMVKYYEYGNYEESVPLILMLYTGIYDKNGDEVFVGDILILPDTESESVDVGIGVDVKVAEAQVNTLAEVVMKNGAFGVEVYEAGEEWPKGFTAFINSDYSAWHTDDLSELEAVIEICGNIHEDSHLLNKEQ